jgi:FAD/FMN-containing dehydrogenase
MTRFNDIVISKDSQTVEIGAGLTWTDVYRYLIPKGLNVVGGRLNGVGVAGLTLGGGECYSFSGSLTVGTEAYMRMAGYSWKTNQYGLTVDSVTEFHLVSPNGTEIVVTEADKDLWFALKVCLNNDEGNYC